jgi:hypothetical protein
MRPRLPEEESAEAVNMAGPLAFNILELQLNFPKIRKNNIAK